jgi:hypothetical protein
MGERNEKAPGARITQEGQQEPRDTDAFQSRLNNRLFAGYWGKPFVARRTCVRSGRQLAVSTRRNDELGPKEPAIAPPHDLCCHGGLLGWSLGVSGTLGSLGGDVIDSPVRLTRPLFSSLVVSLPALRF